MAVAIHHPRLGRPGAAHPWPLDSSMTPPRAVSLVAVAEVMKDA